MLAPEAVEQQKQLALQVLSRALPAKFDRQPFRPLVLPLLNSNNHNIRASALNSFRGLDPSLDDLDYVLPLVEDPATEIRKTVGGVLISIAQGKEPETVIPALMRLLQDPETEVVDRTIRSMWGQYTSPEFDQLLIKLSYEQQYHNNVIYFCLSTMRTKSVAVCRRLVEELSDPDWNNSGRAAWGLTYGVPEEAKTLIEEGLLKALPEEINTCPRTQEFRALRGVATEKSRPYLQSVVASELETDEFKELAREILEQLGPEK